MRVRVFTEEQRIRKKLYGVAWRKLNHEKTKERDRSRYAEDKQRTLLDPSYLVTFCSKGAERCRRYRSLHPDVVKRNNKKSNEKVKEMLGRYWSLLAAGEITAPIFTGKEKGDERRSLRIKRVQEYDAKRNDSFEAVKLLGSLSNLKSK